MEGLPAQLRSHRPSREFFFNPSLGEVTRERRTFVVCSGRLRSLTTVRIVADIHSTTSCVARSDDRQRLGCFYVLRHLSKILPVGVSILDPRPPQMIPILKSRTGWCGRSETEISRGTKDGAARCPFTGSLAVIEG